MSELDGEPTVNEPKKRKLIGVRNMSADERREYRRNLYQMKILKNVGTFSDKRSEKNQNQKVFKGKEALRKEDYRLRKKNENESEFNKGRAREKQIERTKKEGCK